MLAALVALGNVDDEHDEAWLRLETAEQAAMLLCSSGYKSGMFSSKELVLFDALHHAEAIANGDDQAARELLATRISDFILRSSDLTLTGSSPAIEPDLQDVKFNFKVKSALMQLAALLRNDPMTQPQSLLESATLASNLRNKFSLGDGADASEAQSAMCATPGGKWKLLQKQVLAQGAGGGEDDKEAWFGADAVAIARSIVEQGSLCINQCTCRRVQHVHCGVGMLAAKLVPLIADANSFAASRFLCAMQLAYRSYEVYASAGKQALEEAVTSIETTLANVLRLADNATNLAPCETELTAKVEALLGPCFECSNEVDRSAFEARLTRILEASGCWPTPGHVKAFSSAHSADGSVAPGTIASRLKHHAELKMMERIFADYKLTQKESKQQRRRSLIVEELEKARNDSEKLTTESMISVLFATPNSCSGESTLVIDIKLFGSSLEGFPRKVAVLAPIESIARSLLYGLRTVVGLRISTRSTRLMQDDVGWEKVDRRGMSMAESRSLESTQNKGLLVLHVTDPGPAKTAGIEPGEFLHAIDSVEFHSNIDFEETVKHRTPGDLVKVRVYNLCSGFRMVEMELGAVGKTMSEVRKIRKEGGVSINVIWDRKAFARAKAKPQQPASATKLHRPMLTSGKVGSDASERNSGAAKARAPSNVRATVSPPSKIATAEARNPAAKRQLAAMEKKSKIADGEEDKAKKGDAKKVAAKRGDAQKGAALLSGRGQTKSLASTFTGLESPNDKPVAPKLAGVTQGAPTPTAEIGAPKGSVPSVSNFYEALGKSNTTSMPKPTAEARAPLRIPSPGSLRETNAVASTTKPTAEVGVPKGSLCNSERAASAQACRPPDWAKSIGQAIHGYGCSTNVTAVADGGGSPRKI